MSPEIPDRKNTKIELGVLTSSMNFMCSDLDRAFKPITRINTKLVKTTNDPRLISFTNPDTDLIIYSFEVRIDQISGIMELVFPIEAFDPYRQSLMNLLHLDDLEGKGWSEIITENLGSMPVTVMAQTGLLDLTVKQLIELKVGDIVPIDHDPNTNLNVLVEGIMKFSGTPGQHDHRRSVRITKTLQ